MWQRALLCAVGGLEALGCLQGADRLRDATFHQPCEQVLAEHSKVSSDPAYKEETASARESYEFKVAECYLEARKPERALEFVKGWQHDRTDRLMIVARASAQLDREADCQAVIGQLAQHRDLSPAFYVDYPEFRNYAGKDWFVELAVTTWLRAPNPVLPEFASKLMRLAEETLLPLEIAVADPQRPTGEWAVWVGTVRGGQMDRGGGETLLLAEGVDVKERLVDRSVRSLETKGTPGGVETTPTYDETYQEAFIPNGRRFVVKYAALSERLVAMRMITAFGRYAGRDPEQGWPVLNAIAIVERRSAERFGDGH